MVLKSVRMTIPGFHAMSVYKTISRDGFRITLTHFSVQDDFGNLVKVEINSSHVLSNLVISSFMDKHK